MYFIRDSQVMHAVYYTNFKYKHAIQGLGLRNL